MGSIFDWSMTADDNATADDGINWAEGQAPSTVNNSARVVMARVAEILADLGGALAATGTNSLSVSSNSAFDGGATDYVTGRMLAFKAANTNTDAMTLNVSSVAAKAIVKITSKGEQPLDAGDIVADGIYIVRYDETADEASGAWVLQNPAPAAGVELYIITTSTEHWTVPLWATRLKVELVGGGGGGAGANANTAGESVFGGGGGAGGYVLAMLSDLPEELEIVIGAAGSAGGSGSQPGADGGVGGDTTVDATDPTIALEATGGGGGTNSGTGSVAATVNGGAGGVGSGGDLNLSGAKGERGYRSGVTETAWCGGIGASGPFGTGGATNQNSATSGNAGNAASGYGAGGGGARARRASAGSGENYNGGAGTKGAVVIHAYR